MNFIVSLAVVTALNLRQYRYALRIIRGSLLFISDDFTIATLCSLDTNLELHLKTGYATENIQALKEDLINRQLRSRKKGGKHNGKN